MLVHFLSSLNY